MKAKATKQNKLPPKEKQMRDTQFEKLTIRELKELRLKVDSAIASRQIEDRNELREKFREMAETAGFALNEIIGAGRGSKGRTVAAKFANPGNPEETWSGRGRQPKWLAAKLKSGAKLDDFRL